MTRQAILAVAALLGVGAVVALVRAQDGTRSVLRSISDSASEPTLTRPPASRASTPTDASIWEDAATGSGLPEARQAQASSLADRLKRLRASVQRDGTTRVVEPRPATETTPAPITGPVSANPANPDSSRRTRPRTTPDALPEEVDHYQPTETDAPRMSVGDESPADSEGSVVDAPRFTPTAPVEPNSLPVASPAAPLAPAAALPSSEAEAIAQSMVPMLRVETTGPPAIALGKAADYTITLTNQGTVPAHGIYVRVSLPASVRLEGAAASSGTAQPQEEGSQRKLVWTIDQARPQAQETLKLSLKPIENQPFDLLVDWTVRPISSLAKIEVQQPRLEMTLFGPKDVQYGETAVYTIQLTNPGNGDAEDVKLSFAYGARKLDEKVVGTLSPGEQTEINVELTAQQAGELRVAAVATAAGDLRAEATENVLVRRAKLEVDIAGSSLKFSGSVGTYRVRIKNVGDAAASGVAASILLPQGAKLVGTGNSVDGRVAQPIGDLIPGGERTITLQCQLTTPGDNRLEALATAAGELECSSHIVTKVESLADLKLVVNDPRGPTAIGDDTVYEIHITNRGTKAAEQVSVVGQFSEGIEPLEATGAKADVVTGQVLFQRIPRIEPGEELVLKIVARADRPGNHRFRAELTCQSPETQLIAEETTYFFGEEAPSVSSNARAGTTPR